MVQSDVANESKRLPARFYRASSGRELVREWLKSLDPEERCLIGTDIMTVEFGWPVSMPVCKPLGKGLWEVRTNLPDGKISRVLFCIHEDQKVLLQGFIKKAKKIPKRDLDLAREGQSEVEGR